MNRVIVVCCLGGFFAGFVFGATLGASLELWGGMRERATYDALVATKDSLAQETNTCRYHVNRAHGRMSSLETDVAAALRRGRR